MPRFFMMKYMSIYSLAFIVLIPILCSPLWVTIWPAFLIHEELRFSLVALLEVTFFILVIQSPAAKRALGGYRIDSAVFSNVIWFTIFLLSISLLFSGNYWVSLRFST